eukprot:scaffold78630_cov65-Phaeocystis_antarctica.AAC.1
MREITNTETRCSREIMQRKTVPSPGHVRSASGAGEGERAGARFFKYFLKSGSRTGTLQVGEFAHRCRSKAHAEWSGAMSHGCGKVSDTRGLHKDPALANWSQNFTPLGVSG